MDKFMKRAVELAFENVQNGGQPFGAVLVKDGEVVSEGVNELHIKHDISGHAELLAIRRAQEQFQTNDLSGFTMYASGAPCAMCYSAMMFAGIEKAYYCATLDDAKAVGLGKSAVIYDELQKTADARKFDMCHMEIEENMPNPMELWKERNV
ncbi:nucleoside deaminase [Psychrobacillus glaciei]|uniref:Nucleoside deaminase n=1 Tax=Psychrobacillus glaciei TaxID=2283160 RepID=A0A5J6SJT6_9BACI|nr:nucleoside deaminase [Psychrobacillus glaciei]QFF98098.1 nucleoside deaminase [Psychrobacillus glaciei]